MPQTNSRWRSNLRRAHRSRTTMQQSPHWLQWDTPNSPPKLPLLLRRSLPPSNTPILRLASLTIPNGIPIQPAVLPQYTFRSYTETNWPIDRQTDRWDRRQVYTISAYTCYIDREQRAKNFWKIAWTLDHLKCAIGVLFWKFSAWFCATGCIVAVYCIQAESYLIWTAEEWSGAGQWPSHTVWRDDWMLDGQSSYQQEHCWHWGSRKLWDLCRRTHDVLSGDWKQRDNCLLL